MQCDQCDAIFCAHCKDQLKRDNETEFIDGSWRGSARNHRVENGYLKAELKKMNGLWKWAEIQHEPGNMYENIDGVFRKVGKIGCYTGYHKYSKAKPVD